MPMDKMLSSVKDGSAGPWRQRARKLKDRGEWAELESLSRERLQKSHDEPLASAYLGYALAGKEDREGAVAALEIGAGEPKEAIPALLLRARLLQEMGNQAKSINILDKAFKDNPEDQALVLALIKAHIQANRLLTAVDLAHHLTKLAPDNPAPWRALCETSMAVGNYAEAVEAAGKVLALDPDDGVVARYQALSLSKMGYSKEAIQALKTHLSHHASDRDGWHDVGIMQVREGMNDDAVVSFGKARELDPGSFQTALALGTLLAKLNKNAEASKHLEAAVQADGTSKDAKYNLAIVYEKLGKNPQALLLYEKNISTDEPHLPSALNRGILLAKIGRVDEARQQLEWATEKDPHSVPILFNLACVYTALGDNFRAYTTFKRVLHHDPFDREAWQLRGSALARSLNVDEKSVLSWVTRGEELFARGAFVEAHECFRRALDIDPGNQAARKRRAQTLASVYSVPPEDAGAWYRVARMLVELRLLSDAMDAVNILFSFRPRDADGRVLVGRILGSLDKHSAALAQAEIALKEDPNHTGALALKGESLLSLGRLEESLHAFENLLTITPNDPIALTFRGVALCKLKRSDEGLKAFDSAIAVDPRHRDAWYQKGLELEREGHYEGAIEAFTKGFQ